MKNQLHEVKITYRGYSGDANATLLVLTNRRGARGIADASQRARRYVLSPMGRERFPRAIIRAVTWVGSIDA